MAAENQKESNTSMFERAKTKAKNLWADKRIRATVIAVVVGVLSVIVTVVLRVLEALLAGQISIVSVGEIPNIPAFLYSEYSAVGSDLVVVAFSLLVGAWAAARSEVPKADTLAFPALLMFCFALSGFLVKGFADQAVANYESKIVSGRLSIVEKFQAIESQCSRASADDAIKEDTRLSELREVCDKIRTRKKYQILVPIALGLVTIAVAAFGLSRT